MNTLKNVVKRAVAIGSGALMIGATVGAVAAAGLADYPAPFITNGQFDGLIVVGEKAASADIIGAIDIAASLQASSTTPVSTSGVVKNELTGDAAQIGDSGDILEIGEFMGAVTETLTDADLEMLRDGSITTSKGTTDFTQTLSLDVTPTGDSGKVLLDENNDDVTGMFLFFDGGSPVFEYELEFTSGLQSDIDTVDNKAEDLEDEAIFMMGNWYTIVDTTVPESSNDVTLDLIAGDVSDTLSEGETKTYEVNGKEYEVSVLIIGTRSDETTVKFLVNGEATDSLTDGETDTLSDGLEIGVRDIIQTTAYRERDPSSIVEFYLGANKITIEDLTADNAGWEGNVEINGEDIEDLEADISATITATDVRINSMRFRLKIDAAENTDIYLAEGEGLRAMLDEPQGMIGTNWDIVYQGLSEPSTDDIVFDADGDDQYNLVFTNRRGESYTVPYAFAGAAGNDANFGSEDDNLIFAEMITTNVGAADAPAVANDYLARLDDYLVVTDVTAGGVDTSDDTYVLQFTDVSEDDTTVSFENVASGGEITATYTGNMDTATAAAPTTGDLTIGGKDFTFWLYDGGSGDYRLAVDLDNSGDYGAASGVYDIVDIVVRGGGILTPANEFPPAGGSWFATLTTQAEDVDSDVAQIQAVPFTESATAAELDAGTVTSSAGTFYSQSISDEDKTVAVNAYGTWFEKTDETDQSDTVTISYPSEQVEALVYVTGTDVTSRTVGSLGGASRVNPISVGAAVLDRDATYDQDNMIVVGGPCANTMAAQLLGNPAVCGEGFTAGHAMIRLFDTGQNTAILVAGYEAEETVAASRVLAEYSDYELTGNEVDVTVSNARATGVSPK